MATLRNLQKVAKGVYRSGKPEEDTIDHIIDLGIKTVISLKTNKIENHWEKEYLEDHGVKYFNLPMLLVPEIDQHKIIKAFNYLINAPRPILVHCTRGSDRTGVAVATYRILYEQWNAEDAIKEMDELGFNNVFSIWKNFLREIAIR